jgi:hypothetical protein
MCYRISTQTGLNPPHGMFAVALDSIHGCRAGCEATRFDRAQTMKDRSTKPVDACQIKSMPVMQPDMGM